MSDKVTVEKLPDCDFCKEIGMKVEATHDGKTVFGPWSNMCDDCFSAVGLGLGCGRGQKLILKEA